MHVLSDVGLCYLATPYSKYPTGIVAAFGDAARLGARLLLAGVKFFCPIAHSHPIATYGQLDVLSHDVWLPFDEAMMAVCAVLVVAKMEGWDKSFGIAHEIAFFARAGKPVFYLDPATLAISASPRGPAE